MNHDPCFDIELDAAEIAALLGREDAPVHRVTAGSRAADRHGTVLVTGAGGSIGSLLVRHLASSGTKVLALDRIESGLFLLGLRLREEGSSGHVRMVVRDVADPSLRRLMIREEVDLVVHAAAHKHVALMESETGEAFLNNAEKTRVILEMAAEGGACGFLLVSTDKAVEPVSVMGKSKAAAERIVMDSSHGSLARRVLRLPNVLGSAGSAVQVFRRALLLGNELLVRDARAERLYIGPGEALSNLVAAIKWPGTGRLAPVEPPAISTLELARRAHRLWSPATEFRWRDVGLGPGERLRERLIGEVESWAEGPQGLRLIRSAIQVRAG